MGIVTRYGREFEFADDTPADVQEKRIQNWMGLHAADELTPAPARESALPAAPPASNGVLDYLRQAGSRRQAVRQEARPDTIDFLRTAAQGAIPYADEATAGIRSLAGTPYDTALEEERAGPKRFGEKYGEGTKIATELGGAGLGLMATLGASGALQGARVPQLAQLAAKYPKIAAVLGKSYVQAPVLGAAAAGVGGFGAGEGGFEERASNAAGMAPFGAALGLGGLGVVKGIEGLGNIFGKDNKVADFLRKRLTQDRGEAYKANPNIPRNPDGTVNTSHPDFATLAGDDLRQAMAEQRRLSLDPRGFGANKGQDVMTADVLPGTTESALLHPGENQADLTRKIVKRQYDPTLPQDAAREASQMGHVEKWFDRAFGKNNFRGTEEQLLATRKAAADAGFQPAFQKNVRGADIEDALNDPYVGKAWKAAKEKMEAERKPIGTINPISGNISEYNTEFLHKLKTTMDDMITAARKQPAGTTGADTARVIGGSKNRLNEAIMAVNPEYKAAMKEFGDHSSLIDALRKGREDVFGKNVNTLDKGIGKQDIEAFLQNPNVSNAEKELFRVGAARALKQNLLGSDTKKFTHNWADVLGNPNMEEKYRALMDPSKMGSWDVFRAQINQLSQRRKNMEGALGNSKTAKRGQMIEELESPNVLSNIVATGVNPSAPSGWRHWVQTLTDPATQNRRTTGEVAKILGQSGPRGNTEAADRIKDLLSRYQTREGKFRAAKGRAGPMSAWAYPYRQATPPNEPE